MTSIVRCSRFLFALLIAVAASWGQPVSAGLVFIYTDDGTDTTVNWSGTLNIDGLLVEDNGSTLSGNLVRASLSPIIVAMNSSPKLRIDNPFSSLAVFGTAGSLTPTNIIGDNIGLSTFGGDLFLPQGYTSGSPLSGSFQFLNQTVASMGIVDTPNAFVLTNGDTVAVGVPEPSTYAMALAGLACGGYTMFRRRNRA
jgi:hypothetical protein